MVVRNLPHPPARVGSKFGKESLVRDVTSPFDIAVSSLCTEFDIPNFAFAHSKIEIREVPYIVVPYTVPYTHCDPSEIADGSTKFIIP